MAASCQVLPGDSGVSWQPWGHYQDILLDRCVEGIARVAINRPARRNAFRPQTVAELCDASAGSAMTAISVWCCSPESVLLRMVPMPSVPVVIRAFGVTGGMWGKTAFPG